MACLTPVIIRDKAYAKHKLLNPNATLYIPVDCGTCAECLKKKRAQWFLRGLFELKNSFSSYFVRLSYSDDTLPWYDMPNDVFKRDILVSEADDNLYPSVCPRDVTLFFKRMRKYLSTHYPLHEVPVKYLLVSEYGGLTCRPHYHFLIFNFPGDKKQLSTALLHTWKNGQHNIGDVEEASINYVLKYIVNHNEHPQGCYPNFFRVSHDFGGSFANETLTFYADNPNQLYYPVGDRKISLPRYYVDIFSKLGVELQVIPQDDKLMPFEEYCQKYKHKSLSQLVSSYNYMTETKKEKQLKLAITNE